VKRGKRDRREEEDGQETGKKRASEKKNWGQRQKKDGPKRGRREAEQRKKRGWLEGEEKPKVGRGEREAEVSSREEELRLKRGRR
jgi:hypothetical protein